MVAPRLFFGRFCRVFIRSHSTAPPHKPAVEEKLYAVIAYDYPDSLERRIKNRPDHLRRAQTGFTDGIVVTGGALLDREHEYEGCKMMGSLMVIRAKSAEACKQYISQDPYVTGKVWDTSRLAIHPLNLARKQ